MKQKSDSQVKTDWKNKGNLDSKDRIRIHSFNKNDKNENKKYNT